MAFDASRHYQGEAAAGYDQARTTDPKWQAEQASVGRFIDLLRPESVLDVPVGTGRFLPLYPGRVVGIDISEDMLAQARQRETGTVELDLRVGDITALALDDDAVEAAVCVRLLNLVPFEVVDQALRELERVTTHHLIVGIRLRQPETLRHRVYQARRWARGLRSRRKVTPHSPRSFNGLLHDLGLQVLERDEIDRWPDGSTYFMFLLQTK